LLLEVMATMTNDEKGCGKRQTSETTMETNSDELPLLLRYHFSTSPSSLRYIFFKIEKYIRNGGTRLTEKSKIFPETIIPKIIERENHRRPVLVRRNQI